MNFLKTLPISYSGALHNVRLINFNVDMADIEPWLPKQITPLLYNGRPIVSMVHVQLKDMRLGRLPFRFNYEHIALRLVVDDQGEAMDAYKGVFFLRSFTPKGWLVPMAKLLTSYRLETVKTEQNAEQFMLITRKGEHLKYWAYPQVPTVGDQKLFKHVHRLDRAYSVVGDRTYLTCIERENWPIEWLSCGGLEISFLPSAELLGAFQIKDPVAYRWRKPVFFKDSTAVQQSASLSQV